jgi:hypothetical protein
VPRSITVGLSLARAGVWRAMTRPLLATLVALALAGCGATTRTITVAANTHTAATPILAEPWSSNQKGYGEVEPRTIFNGGDPTGLMREINWITWGGPVAVGEGLNISRSAKSERRRRHPRNRTRGPVPAWTVPRSGRLQRGQVARQPTTDAPPAS